MAYWIYKNTKNTIDGKPRTIIHLAECGHCKNGTGVSCKGTEPNNGEWIGPVNSVMKAEEMAYDISSDYRKCDHCKP